MKTKNLLLCIFFMAILVPNLLGILHSASVDQNPLNNSISSFNTTGISLTEEYNDTYHGFVHVSPEDPRYLVFDDGTPFYPVGINTGWWLDESEAQYMKAHNISLGRVWMCSWHINIEHPINGGFGLGIYDESEAQKLDAILALAEQYDFYIQLVLLTFTDFAYEHGDHWNDTADNYAPSYFYANPYNARFGGPIASNRPIDFFTDETAKYYFKKRLNYILDRWGDNHRIAIWEFWNEVSLVGWGYPPQATDGLSKAWQEEMAQVFYENDTHQRPLTTSAHGDVFWDQTFLSDANDIIQIHTYATNNPVTLAPLVSSYVKRYENSGKPVVIGEYGITSGDKVEFLHNGLWAALASGAGGSSMYWYTNHAEMSEAMWDRYLYFETFIRDIPWPSLNISDGTAILSGATNTDVYSIQGNSFALAWVFHKVSGTVSGAQLSFSNLTNDDYVVYVYDDSTGTYLNIYAETVSNGSLAVNLPDFGTHLAVKVVGTLSALAPTANFTYSPAVPSPGETAVFNASSSLPGWNGTGDTPIVSYTWDFGDYSPEVTELDPIANHAYAVEGVYNVTLKVTDNRGWWNTTFDLVYVSYNKTPPYTIHSLAIVDLDCRNVYVGMSSVNFYVTVRNFGTEPENFSVAAEYTNGTPASLGTQNVTGLVAGAEESLIFPWSLSGIAIDTYIFTFNVSVVQGENSTADNVAVEIVQMRWPGDANGDGFIGGYDATLVSINWWMSAPPASQDADFNGDGFIGGYDATVVSINWWTHVPKP